MSFPPGDGAMARRIRAHDWSRTPLGPIDDWPPSLRTTVALMLGSGHPMYLAWGPRLTSVFNDAYVPMLGAKAEGALGAPFAELWPELWRQLEGLVEAALSGRGTWAEDMPMTLRRNGYDETAWFTFSYSPAYDDAGRPAGLLATLIETTRRVRDEQRRRFLMALDEAIRPLLDPSELMAAVAQRLGRHLDVDRCAYAVVEPDENHFTITGDYVRGVASLLGRYALSAFGAEALASARRGEPYVVDDTAADRRIGADERAAYHDAGIGAVIQVPLLKAGRFVAGMAVHQRSARRWSSDEVALVAAVAGRCWEALERMRAAMAQRASEERMRGAMRIGTVGILSFRLDGSIDDANAAFERMSGYAVDELRAIRDWRVLTPPEFGEPTERAARELAERGVTAPYEKQMIRKDGSRWWGLFAPTRIAGAGIGSECVEFIVDVTQAKAAEAALREADARKDEFLAMLAHELRNPLAPISNAHALIERTEPLGAHGRKALAVAQRQTRQLARLVDDLLEVSRITRGKIALRPEPMELGAAVRAAVESVTPGIERRGQRLEVALPRQPLRVVADPARIAQILENLLTNASKYTHEGGAIRVEANEATDHVEVRVIDDGVGIAPEQMSRLFEPFSQAETTLDRAQGGLGIGLALVRRLAELHGGTATAASEGLGEGATFTVRLPRQPSPAAAG